MILKNGFVFTDEGKFSVCDVETNGDVIVRLAPAGTLHGAGEVDVSGQYVIPGLVDIHIHGAKGSDFCDNSVKDIETMAAYLGGEGVTSFCGTTMAFSEEILSDIFDTAKPLIKKEGLGAVLRGINMEGPFFSKAKKGAQAEEYIINPDAEMFDRLFEKSGENIRFIDVAPELDGCIDFIAHASQKCAVSVAHTTANYDEAQAAYLAGACHTTHLFNAMPAFNHREPGVIGAASDYAAHVEMISDGIHLHPAVVRSVFKWFGDDRVCLISDSMRACGMPNGDYSLGGQKVIMKDCKATLEDGTIAGSATCLAECMRKAVSFGVPIESAIKAATMNPAKAANLYDIVGSITAGKRADILVMDTGLQPTSIIIGGKKTK